MNPPKIQPSVPASVASSRLLPIAPTHHRGILVLLFALLLLLTFRLSAAAQQPQSDAQPGAQPDTQAYEPGAQVLSDTVTHTAPHRRPVFTDTPPAEEGAQPEEATQALAHAENTSDDFDNSTPTAWWIYNGQSLAEVESTINSDKARIIDIQVDSFSPYSFTVTYVQNTGAYAKSWWWYVGLTQAQVSANLTTNNARLISVKPYDIGGGSIRYAVVMIKNTGADQRKWWWYVGQTVSSISSLITRNKARLITVDAYTAGSKTEYATIMVDNTGTNATAWWWYVNATPATLSSHISQNNARIFYLKNAGGNKFNAIMESCSKGCSVWWWYEGVGGQRILDLAVQNGARMLNLNTYTCGSSTCFAGAMINNSNAITTRVGNLIRNGGIQGAEGLYLEQVSGPGTPGVLANLEDAVPFEPASTIKVLANLYAMNRVQGGKIKLTTGIPHNTDGPESCPSPTDFSGKESLGPGRREKMWHSDNGRTEEITKYFGDPTINKYAKSIGLLNTGFHEIVGCIGTTPDSLTLDDAGTLYAGVANQDLLNATDRGIFYSDMAGRAQYESEGYDWTAVWDNDIPNIINQVAPAGTTAQQKQDYMGAMNTAYKAGNYVICTNSNCTDVVEDIAIAGWFQLPICTASGTTYAEYVWGIMFSNEPFSGWTTTSNTQTDKNFTTAKSELMREQIAAGMASCKGKSLKVMSYSPAALSFTSTAVGSTAASKSVTITNNQSTAVTGLSVSAFGDFTESTTCGASLASKASCTVTVKFKPTTTGERTGAVIVTDNGNGQPQTIELTGTGQ